MKGLIVIDYQGVGKSTCAGKSDCIDLESGCFWIGEKRSEDWYIPYCSIAMDLADQGYTVFTSSHRVVYEHFISCALPSNVGKAVVFCPAARMRNEWINRLQKRYDDTGLAKDYKALLNAIVRYLDNISELENCGLPVYHPASMDYDLMDYVRLARHEWCER